MPARKSPPWSRQELAILHDVYPRDGINGAVDALPDRSWTAICVMASKLHIRSPIVGQAPAPVLQGERLEAAIARREVDGWSFARIGAEFGVAESAACNAVLIALCPRKGFTPAPRDATGRLLPEGIERLRLMLRKGLKGVDIQLRLGVSSSCVAEQRRRYRADLKSRGKAALPPPGAGEAYSGVKLSLAQRRAVEALFMEGYGAKKIGERTSVSHTSIGRIRTRLIKRLKRKGECLPGCDIDGRRRQQKDHARSVPDATVQAFRKRLMNREPVRRAANAEGIGLVSAYKLRHAFAAELAAGGETLPPPILPGRTSTGRYDGWLPADMRARHRQLVRETGTEAAKATILAEIAAKRKAERDRPKSFEEQLEMVRNGARLVQRFTPRRTDPAGTLGGVATGMIE